MFMTESLARDTSKEATPKTRERSERFVNIEDEKIPGNHGWVSGVVEKVEDWGAKRSTKKEIAGHEKGIDKATASSQVHQAETEALEQRRSSLIQTKEELQEKLSRYQKPSKLDTVPGIAWIRSKQKERLTRRITITDNKARETESNANNARKKWQEAEVTKSTFESRRVDAAKRLHDRFEKRLAPIREHSAKLYEREAKLEENIVSLETAKQRATEIIAACEEIRRSKHDMSEAEIALARKTVDHANSSIRKIDAALTLRQTELGKCRAHVERLERAGQVAETAATTIKDRYQTLFVEKTDGPGTEQISIWAKLATLLEGFNTKMTGEKFIKSWNALFGQQIDGKPLAYETLIKWYQAPDASGTVRELPSGFDTASNEHTAEEWKVFLTDLSNTSQPFKTLTQKNNLKNSSEAVNQIMFLFT